MLSIIFLVAAYLFLQMCLIWVLYMIYKNPSIVDGSWSIGLMASGMIYLFSTSITSRKMLVACLLSIWAIRLALHLGITRIRKGHIDKRYTTISSQWKIKQDLGFFLNYQFQASLIFVISFIFFFISQSNATSLSMLDFLAVAIILMGITGESIADLQLERFKKASPGQVCDNGLWYYSRHPNYFFDWLTWLGFMMFGLQSHYGYFSLISVILLYIIFTRITGPITERGSIQSRGNAYLQYQSTTSMFIPWLKR